MPRVRLLSICTVLLLGAAALSVGYAANAPAAKPRAQARGSAGAPNSATSRPAASVPILQFHGDAVALGQAHGQQLGREVGTLFKTYFGQFFGSEAALRRAVEAAMAYEPLLPAEYREEIRALAASAKIAPGEAMLMQCFLDLSGDTACSTIALPGSAAPDGIARFGRNIDFPAHGVADRAAVVFVYHPKDRHAFAAVSWPGVIGVLSGLNEHGLALANMEVQRSQRAPQAMPCTLLYRMLLERCRTVDEAIGLLQKTPRQTANNLMLMDASGARAVAEITPERVVVRHAPDDAPLISTNHQRGSDLQTRGRCGRYDTLDTTARARFGEIGLRDLEQMLASVMQETIQSIVFEPRERVIHLAVGNRAAENAYERIELGARFLAAGR